MKYSVCKTNDMKPGEIKEIKVQGKRMVLCCTGESTFSAVSALCPHQAANLVDVKRLDGTIECLPNGQTGFVKCNEIIRCPRHGYEWDVNTGKALFQTDKLNIKSYKLEVEGEDVVIYM
ncbi:Rieske (2Fe-2S) protein [Neobacillus drentensis]|uniref:Rieske (2Fe-2S) protein n=1 Tax=Neobacillus drentensis TaxID=220684 RepID=UPI0030038999